MNLYLDSAYVAKCYLNDPDAQDVRLLAQGAESLYSSAWCIAELACAFHRRVRERALTREQGSQLRRVFLEHVSGGLWNLLPVTEAVLRGVDASVERLPRDVFLRAGDAIHLVSAQMAGFTEIWSNDRRLLRAARYFGLAGKSA